MTRHDEAKSPGLPIIDEIGQALHRDFVRRERIARRRRAGGVLAGALTIIAAATVALVGNTTQPARAIQIAAGHAGDAHWRLVLAETASGTCLRLEPTGGSPGRDGPCARPRGSENHPTAVRASLGGRSFVYGFSDADTRALTITTNDRSRRVQTKDLPPSARRLHLKPDRVRVYITVVGAADETDAITVEPQGPGNSDVIIRVPRTSSP